jgi:hypothetical protein
MIFSDQYEQEACLAVNRFFSRLAVLVDNVKGMDIDRSAIAAHLADPHLRVAHLRAARFDICQYISVMDDVLLTATQLSDQSSRVSQEILVDWVTAAPEFALERMNPYEMIDAHHARCHRS